MCIPALHNRLHHIRHGLWSLRQHGDPRLRAVLCAKLAQRALDVIGWQQHRLAHGLRVERGVEVHVGAALDEGLGLRLPLVVEREVRIYGPTTTMLPR